MALKSVRSFLSICILTVLLSLALPSGRVQARSEGYHGNDLPGLETFIEQVGNGQGEELRGVYIPGLLAAPIVQQPAGMEDFVSPWENVLTQFGLAARFESTGLLAHNYLAGKAFARLQAGQQIHLVFGDGRVATFVVAEIHHYQALDPASTSSDFLNLDSQETLTYSSLFTRMYSQPGRVVFQTCIEQENDPYWGRLFVVAEPASE